MAAYSSELKRIEDSIAAVRRGEHSDITNGRHSSKERMTPKPIISTGKHCTKVDSSYITDKNQFSSDKSKSSLLCC